MHRHRKQPPRGWLNLFLACLLAALVARSHAAPRHAGRVDPQLAEEALAAMLRRPHPFHKSAFEATMEVEVPGTSEASNGTAFEWQDSGALKHWLEVLHGVPYGKEHVRWIDPLTDLSRPVVFGEDTESRALERPHDERAHQGRRLAEEAEGRQLRNAGRKALGLAGRTDLGPTLATVNGSLYRWDSMLAPTSVDWRKTDAITVVKSQGQCASCWSLTAADSISMMWAIWSGAGRLPFNWWKTWATGDPQYEWWGRMDVSAQEICDCGPLGTCCQSGWPESAYSYVLSNGGVSSWQTYPYFQSDSICRPELKTSTKAQITGWEMVPFRSPEALRKAISQQPILVFISAGAYSFQRYLGGFYDGDCGEDLDHVMLAVGYGTSPQWGPYYILKNSWGTNWGDNGYMYIAANPGNGKCGMLSAPGLYPTYHPQLADPCNAYPNPCGAGTCYSTKKGSKRKGTFVRTTRCGCPKGYVENAQTNPAKCVKADPCSANPNPCGCGACTNLPDGSYGCTCPLGYKAGSRTDGAPTCAPLNKQGGAPTISTVDGSTVQDVSTGYNVSARVLLQLNPWVDSRNGSEIPAGSSLSIAPANSTTLTNYCIQTYIVQGNDTCASVASAYNTTAEQLAYANPLADCSNLLRGAELCIQRNASTNGVAAPPQCGTLYQVQDGDTCASVKLALQLTDDLFALLNPGLTCDQALDPSVILCTGVGTGPDRNCTAFYTVQHGDTCPSIALMANLTQPQLLQLNKGFRCTIPYLQVGQRVCVDSPSLATDAINLVPYTVQQGDSLSSISQMYIPRCGDDASQESICAQNSLPNCSNPAVGSVIQIPCTARVGRTCGCEDGGANVFGSDGVWYDNFCKANCNYALPVTSYSTFCGSRCKDRAGLSPANDPSNQCSKPCPWPQWNPIPDNWWWFANTVCGYYLGACQDWCSSSASTVCAARDDWNNWSNYYNSCVSSCRYGKC